MKLIMKLFKLFGWMPALAWAAVIYWLSNQSEPVDPGMWLPPFADKIVHMGLFGVLAWLIYPVIRIKGYRSFFAACIALALSSLYGIFDEVHQSSVPGRFMDINDWIADTIGAASVFLLRAQERRLAGFVSRLLSTP